MEKSADDLECFSEEEVEPFWEEMLFLGLVLNFDAPFEEIWSGFDEMLFLGWR